MSERTSREWAHAYSTLGWRVFPTVPGGKRPMYSGWQRDATTDPELIRRYFRGDSGPNVAIVCGEAFDAFDVEAAHLPALRAWIEGRGNRLPDTPIARTGRGGIHILVRPVGERGRVLRLDGQRIGELKARGGFIVVCPSRTERLYGWLRSPLEVDVADAPAWLNELAVQPDPPPPMSGRDEPLAPSHAVALMAGLYRVVARAAEGERNQILFWASCRVAERGVDRQAASEILLAAARTAGLPEREARATISSGLLR